ncbi:MAG TPA: carboxypeptidase-like regulatory domain-containing protein [Puia sp.]|nr:carboxypeptidase-like regulatory domain-containing protein [Puia sp.]
MTVLKRWMAVAARLLAVITHLLSVAASCVAVITRRVIVAASWVVAASILGLRFADPPCAHGACDVFRLQTSGLQGRLYLVGGNRMPSPPRHAKAPGDDTVRHPPKGPGIKGTICVFELTNDRQVTRQGTSPYCEAVHTKLIRQADTDDKGNFRIPLPPGTYSVFTRKGKLFYATRRDEQNNIAPVKVLPGKMTRLDISVESDQRVLY